MKTHLASSHSTSQIKTKTKTKTEIQIQIQIPTSPIEFGSVNLRTFSLKNKTRSQMKVKQEEKV